MIAARWCARWAHGILVCGALALAPPLVSSCAKALATPPKGPEFVLTLAAAARAPGDTARYALTIIPPLVTPSSPAVLGWHVRLLGADTTKDSLSTLDYLRALVYHNFAGARLVDTVAVVTPLTFTDSTGPYRLAVQGFNQFGNGAWAKSPPWYVKRRGLPPGPPGIIVDSTTLNRIGIARVETRPQLVTKTPGVAVQLCPFAIGTNGVKYQFGDSTRATSSAGVTSLERFDTITVCKIEFAKYLAERPA